MRNDLGIKLIVVADIKKLIFYAAKGIKITETLDHIAIPVDKHHRGEKSGSHIQKGDSMNSLYEPHTPPNDIEHKEAADFICREIEKQLANKHDFKEIIIVADPKSLGFIRHQLGNNVKKLVTKELAKDLTHHSMQDVEGSIF